MPTEEFLSTGRRQCDLSSRNLLPRLEKTPTGSNHATVVRLYVKRGVWDCDLVQLSANLARGGTETLEFSVRLCTDPEAVT